MTADPQELIAQMFLQLNERIDDHSVASGRLVAGVYAFLIRQGVATRKDVHDHLRAQAEASDDSERGAKLKRIFNAMADAFRDDAPQDPRAVFRLIDGGLGDPK